MRDGRRLDRPTVNFDVEDGTARSAHHVVMLVDVGIETGRSPIVEHLDFAKLSKIVEHLIHGLQRNHRKLLTSLRKQRLGRGMRCVVLQQTNDKISLGRDLAAVGPKVIV